VTRIREAADMKHAVLFAVIAVAPAWLASPAHAMCSSCNIQSKNPSTSQPGKFDYRVS
jgi:hypothetical protein